jgi:hypothetical protein
MVRSYRGGNAIFLFVRQLAFAECRFDSPPRHELPLSH